MSIQAEKQQLRRQYLEYRNIHYRDVEPLASESICRHLLDLPFLASQQTSHISKIPVISGYMPMQGEVNILPALHQLHDQGVTICLPVVVAAKQPLIFRIWQPGMVLDDGVFQTRIPPASSPQFSPDILLVPLLAFDRQGHRIGFGAGFYDRTLEALRQQKPIIAVGVAFSFQETPLVPILPTDQALDGIVTESEVISPLAMSAASKWL